MKKLILSLVMVGFAVAVQAGDSKTCSKDKAACATTKVGESSCCSSMTKATKASSSKQTLMSPKGAEQSAKMLVASR